jgi:hypothetical protein
MDDIRFRPIIFSRRQPYLFCNATGCCVLQTRILTMTKKIFSLLTVAALSAGLAACALPNNNGPYGGYATWQEQTVVQNAALGH